MHWGHGYLWAIIIILDTSHPPIAQSLLQWHIQTRDKWIALATFLPNSCLEDVAGEWMWDGISELIHPVLINWNRIPHIPMGNNKDKLLSDILTLLVRTSLRDDRTDQCVHHVVVAVLRKLLTPSYGLLLCYPPSVSDWQQTRHKTQ